jgi:hypothetical protein
MPVSAYLPHCILTGEMVILVPEPDPAPGKPLKYQWQLYLETTVD